jgi:1-acyl-sn-glycerol-3-phosphate acyltransferase
MLQRIQTSLTGLTKFMRCIAHLLHGIWTIRRHFAAATAEQRQQHISVWAQAFLRIIDVELRITGSVVTNGPLLVVANHISWLDILVMLAVQPVRFVSKHEIKTWPLIGWLATNVGTLYIERASRRDAMRVVHQIAAALTVTDGLPPSIIAIFPEGTTTDGSTVLPFHGNLIQSALSADAPVQPVTLRFLDADTGTISLTPAYIDDDTLLSSVWRLLSSASVQAHVHFAEPERAQGRDRRAWAADLQRRVADSLKP